MEAQPEDISCVACATTIKARARICPNCGTRQNPYGRWFVRAVAGLSAVSLLLSIVTVGISLFPSAWTALFPEEAARLYEIGFDSASLTRRQARFNLANTGNQDLYLNRIKLEAAAPELSDFRGLVFVISEWLRTSENREFLVPLKPLGGKFSAVPVAGFAARLERLSVLAFEPRGCFRLLVHPADPDGPRPVPAHSAAKATFPMQATLFYSSARTRGEPKELALDLDVRASLMYDERCDELAERAKSRRSDH